MASLRMMVDVGEALTDSSPLGARRAMDFFYCEIMPLN
jgi:hypothetical protein